MTYNTLTPSLPIGVKNSGVLARNTSSCEGSTGTLKWMANRALVKLSQCWEMGRRILITFKTVTEPQK